MKSSDNGLEYTPKDVGSVWTGLVQNVKERKDKPSLPTKIQALDEAIWGLHKRELLVIAARPGHGKTSLSLSIAWNLAKEQRAVVFCSLEMGEQEILERVACSEMRINGFKLRCGDEMEMKSFLDQEEGFRNILLSTTLHVEDRFGKNVQEVEAMLKAMEPEVLIIDHAQMISSKGFQSKQEALANYVRSMKILSIKYNVAIVLNSQINRMGANSDNAMEYLKGSGELEESADTVIQCKWPFRDDKNQPPHEYIVRVIKQRHGPIKEEKIGFDARYYRFDDLIQEPKPYAKVSYTEKYDDN